MQFGVRGPRFEAVGFAASFSVEPPGNCDCLQDRGLTGSVFAYQKGYRGMKFLTIQRSDQRQTERERIERIHLIAIEFYPLKEM